MSDTKPADMPDEPVVPRIVAATGHAIRARWDVDGEGGSLASGAGSAEGSGMRRVQSPANDESKPTHE